jgi:ArsR family transcriptional regulator
MSHRRRICPPHIDKAAELLRLLGDPTRLEIVRSLARKREGMAVYEVAEALGLSHSAASHQLGNLDAHGLAVGIREGQHIRYVLKETVKVRMMLRILRMMRIV